MIHVVNIFFFFKKKTAYELRISDWSSDVCSFRSAEQRGNFSFTPALTDRGRQNRAITVVIRARDDASSAARTSALAAGRTAPVAIAPVKYNLGASVGFEKFVTPSLPRGTDLRNLPEIGRAHV